MPSRGGCLVGQQIPGGYDGRPWHPGRAGRPSRTRSRCGPRLRHRHVAAHLYLRRGAPVTVADLRFVLPDDVDVVALPHEDEDDDEVMVCRRGTRVPPQVLSAEAWALV